MNEHIDAVQVGELSGKRCLVEKRQQIDAHRHDVLRLRQVRSATAQGKDAVITRKVLDNLRAHATGGTGNNGSL